MVRGVGTAKGALTWENTDCQDLYDSEDGTSCPPNWPGTGTSRRRWPETSPRTPPGGSSSQTPRRESSSASPATPPPWCRPDENRGRARGHVQIHRLTRAGRALRARPSRPVRPLETGELPDVRGESALSVPPSPSDDDRWSLEGLVRSQTRITTWTPPTGHVHPTRPDRSRRGAERARRPHVPTRRNRSRVDVRQRRGHRGRRKRA